jgi:hypothetical protein
MSVPDGKVPIFQSVQATFTAWREGLVGTLPAAGLVALVAAGMTLLLGPSAATNPMLGFVSQAVLGVAMAIFFAGVMGPTFGKPGGLNAGSVAGGLRVFGAMAVIGFFLLIVFVVAMIPGIAVFATALTPYMTQLEAAQGDPAATMTILQQVMTENPAVFILLGLIYGFVWMALTSRLFLAAPASVDAGKVMSFDTWSWTKGNMLRIMAARLLLLVPAFFVTAAFASILGPLLGVQAGVVAGVNPVSLGAFAGVNGFVSTLIYSGLEARLAAFLHAGLRPRP